MPEQYPFNKDNIFQSVLAAQVTHNKFLQATEKNLSFYFFGREVPLVKNLTFPQLDLVQTLQAYVPEVYNPLSYFLDAFIDEIANSQLQTNVRPYPVAGKEPYESFADNIEDYLQELHRRSDRAKSIRALIFEILVHGYFGFYSNGSQYWYCSAYNLIPGSELEPDPQRQPMWIRRTQVTKAYLRNHTGINLNREDVGSLDIAPDLDIINLYDTWVKDLDLNVCFTGSGQVLYYQKFPYPKRYPFFIGTDGELVNNFYTKPVVSNLRILLPKLQDGLKNIEESSKSIANPILTYDADAGIDVNALQRALMEGYKRIIVGKNREGRIDFHAPGQLPAYALQFPDVVIGQMMRHLGITETFLGIPTKGVRERGALGRLIKTSFRKLGSVAAIVERALSDLDNYLIDYAQEHQWSLKNNGSFLNVEQIFNDRCISYISEVKFKGFSSEDTSDSQQMSLMKNRQKIIPQSQVLKELGYNQPRKIIEELHQEMTDNNKLAAILKQQAEQPPISILQEVSNRLKGRLLKRYYLTEIADDKILVRCSYRDTKMVAFLLSDLTGKVLIEPMTKLPEPTPAQREIDVKLPEEEFPMKVVPGSEEDPNKPISMTDKTESTPTSTPAVTPEGEPEAPTEGPGRPVEQVKDVPDLPSGEDMKEALQSVTEKDGKPEKKTSNAFSEDKLKSLVQRSVTLKHPEKFIKLPAFYLTEPHAKWIDSGKKLLILKARKFENVINKPYLLAGDKLYGVIIVREILEDFDVEATQKFHMVSPAEAKRWWKGHQLYLYLFEYHPFSEPINYEKPSDVQTFIKEVNVDEDNIGIPLKGDLKPVGLSPWKIPPVHKPEKRAFQPHEVFSIDRLKEIIPESTYDVSEKIDGLRCFTWIHDGKARMFSDEGNRFLDSRVKPLLDILPTIFKHDVLLDGEIIMDKVRRKDVTGYLHAKWTPKPEELKALRYVVWDILYVKNQSIASKPFHTRASVLNLYISKGCKGPICRVKHVTAKRSGIGDAVKKLASPEGAVIRDVDAAYWATHSTFKMKYQFDIDAKIIGIEKTKVGLPIFSAVLRDGTFIGNTYAQAEVKAKPGEVIRVNVDHVSIRPDGSINWYAPKPKSWKEGKITPKSISTTQVGIGGADTIDLVKEIYLTTGGTIDKWNEWWPKHLVWKKEKMPIIIKAKSSL